MFPRATISNVASKTTSLTTNLGSRLCVLAGMPLMLLTLIGCESAFSARKESLQIYQPRVLRLKAGQPVQTVDGIYRPQTDEVWHSDAAFTALENQIINTAAALVQERNRQ